MVEVASMIMTTSPMSTNWPVQIWGYYMYPIHLQGQERAFYNRLLTCRSETLITFKVLPLGLHTLLQILFHCWKISLEMENSWTIMFCLMPSRDSNLVSFIIFFYLGNSQNSQGAMLENMGPDEALECCVWPRNS